jgi:hypothetical protein
MVAGLDALFVLDRVIQAEGHYLKFDENALTVAVTNLDDFLVSFRAATLSPTAGQIAYNFRIGLLSNEHFEAFMDQSTNGLIGIRELCPDASLRDEVAGLPDEVLNQTGIDVLMSAWCRISQEAYLQRISQESQPACADDEREDVDVDEIEEFNLRPR